MAITTHTSQAYPGEQASSRSGWNMTLGAQVEAGGVRFRVWAPKRTRVDVVLEDEDRSFELLKDTAGYFSGLVPNAAPGMSYRYRLDNRDTFPDPCSRYQPQGPH